MFEIIKTLTFALIWSSAHGWDPYPYNPNIHTLGNHGIGGKLHAEIAVPFTHFTNKLVYRENVRENVVRKF